METIPFFILLDLWKFPNLVIFFFLKFFVTVERIDCSKLSVSEFLEKFDKPRKPVIITNVQKTNLINY